MTTAAPFRMVDVAVIGAGAAGLAAARALHDDGVDVLLLEARDRAGGRAYTVRTEDGKFPIELGPEFIHGKAERTFQLLRECGSGTSPIVDSADSGIWEATERVLHHVDLNGPDSSVDAFLRTADSRDAEQARLLIGGFDAAIASDASIIAIAKEWLSDVNDTQARPRDGYGVVMQYLASRLDARLLLDTRVHRIAWSNDGVTIEATRSCQPLQVRARCALVTLPIGVLREDKTLFDPPLPLQKRNAIESIAMGPVVKVVLQMREVFWDAGFYRTPPHAEFPTIWTHLPQQAPVLVAWAGGDAAQQLLARRVDPIGAAIETCEALFPHAEVRGAIRAVYYHDWDRDPYSRGAYSYLRVNAGDARTRLAESVDETLFFAGEATCAADAGTVSGALESGYRSARQVAARFAG